jgi:hypothetical protein
VSDEGRPEDDRDAQEKQEGQDAPEATRPGGPWVPATERMPVPGGAGSSDESAAAAAKRETWRATLGTATSVLVTGVPGSFTVRETEVGYEVEVADPRDARRWRPRAPDFAPPAISVLSDKNTQAAARAIWATPDEWSQDGGWPYYTDDDGVLLLVRPYGTGLSPSTAELALAKRTLFSLADDTVATLVICLGKWLGETGGSRAADGALAAVTVYVDDVLGYRGVKKHHKGGYRRAQKEEAKAHVLALRDLWVRSNDTVWAGRGKRRRQLDVVVDDPLMEVSVESTKDLFGTVTPYAFRVRPGPWAGYYLSDGQRWVTSVLRQVMRYDTRQGLGRLKMRLGLYLTFQWRIRARHGTLDQPLHLRALLEGAKIAAPSTHPERFFPQVVEALYGLHDDGVLAVCEALDLPGRDWRPPADRPPKTWIPEVLAGRWRLLPAGELRDRLPKPKPAPPPSAPAPAPRRPRGRPRKTP